MFQGDNQPKYTEGFMHLLLENEPSRGFYTVDYTHPTVHYNTLC